MSSGLLICCWLLPACAGFGLLHATSSISQYDIACKDASESIPAFGCWPPFDSFSSRTCVAHMAAVVAGENPDGSTHLFFCALHMAVSPLVMQVMHPTPPAISLITRHPPLNTQTYTCLCKHGNLTPLAAIAHCAQSYSYSHCPILYSCNLVLPLS